MHVCCLSFFAAAGWICWWCSSTQGTEALALRRACRLCRSATAAPTLPPLSRPPPSSRRPEWEWYRCTAQHRPRSPCRSAAGSTVWGLKAPAPTVPSVPRGTTATTASWRRAPRVGFSPAALTRKFMHTHTHSPLTTHPGLTHAPKRTPTSATPAAPTLPGHRVCVCFWVRAPPPSASS
jgi:hypothetical protein